MSATKQDYSCLCEGRLPKLSSLHLEWAAPLFRWPSAHLHSYCPWSNDYLAVRRDKRNKTETENSSRLVAATQCSISFQTARLISGLSLLCLLLRFLCDSSLRLQGNSRTGLWMQAVCFVFFSFFFYAQIKGHSHAMFSLRCIQGAK